MCEKGTSDVYIARHAFIRVGNRLGARVGLG